MTIDPLRALGLSEFSLPDKPLLDPFFRSCAVTLSDYTFANTFVWRQSIHLRWRIIHDCLCVFANGDGGLTILFPPLGNGDFARALQESLQICAAYNAETRYPFPTRIEYVSSEFLTKFPEGYCARPMSGDYLYLTQRMIDLEGSDLSSKRKLRGRFLRLYEARTETFTPNHLPACAELLQTWHSQAEISPAAQGADATISLKRSKEEAATLDALTHAQALGLSGMVLYANNKLAGFTLGEMVNADTCSILIEKTDRQFKGAAQYIFSEFCRQTWSHAKWCNVGDDWEIPSLAWTKESYRPAARHKKWILHPPLVQEASPVVQLIDAHRGAIAVESQGQ